MIPGMDPKMLKQAMKRMGLKQEEIDASEVIIKCKNKDIVITEPSVIKVNMMGQENFQISGTITERTYELFTDDDIQTIIEQTSCTKEQAITALEQEKDLAKAILRLKSQ
mgnify:FL=1